MLFYFLRKRPEQFGPELGFKAQSWEHLWDAILLVVAQIFRRHIRVNGASEALNVSHLCMLLLHRLREESWVFSQRLHAGRDVGGNF